MTSARWFPTVKHSCNEFRKNVSTLFCKSRLHTNSALHYVRAFPFVNRARDSRLREKAESVRAG